MNDESGLSMFGIDKSWFLCLQNSCELMELEPVNIVETVKFYFEESNKLLDTFVNDIRQSFLGFIFILRVA